MLKIVDLVKTYGTGDNILRALDGTSLTIQPQEFIAIMGPSGSGKSTFLNILGLLDRPTEGHYYFDGTETSNLTDDDMAMMRLEKIGFVFQNFNLLSRTDALENVMLPLVYQGINRKEREKKAYQILEKMELVHWAKHKPNELSGGQQQRVAIARALINNPLIILADEPTGNLDSKSSAEIMNIFTKLHQEGKTIIMVTHEHDIAAYAKRAIQFKDGKIISDKKNY
jgi:putative ABC transport system ATP-binding protein